MNASLKWLARKTINLFCNNLWSWTALPWPDRESRPATLIIAPHPDDDVLGCAGLMATRKRNGELVHVLYLTDGSASHPDHPVLSPAALARQRRKEAQQATEILGLDRKDLVFLDLQDGTLSELSPKGIQVLSDGLEALFQSHHYNEVFIPLHHDGSAEHESAFRLIRPLLPQPTRLYEYPVWSRWSAWRLSCLILKRPFVCHFGFDRLSEKKKQAIQSHASQFEPVPPWLNPVLPKGFSSLFPLDREFFFPTYEHPFPD